MRDTLKRWAVVGLVLIGMPLYSCAQDTEPVYDSHPVWSHAANKVAFLSTRDGNMEIYVMNPDGTDVVRVTHHPEVDAELAWSPDSTQIAFNARETAGGDFEIYVINADGSNRRQLTQNDRGDYTPRWSPDGQTLLFSSNRDDPDGTDMNGNRELYTMRPDGSEQQRLTHFNARTAGPAWSPDGTRLAFASNKTGNMEIFVMDLDGANLTQLTESNQEDGYPTWSPDGTRIGYTSGTWDPYAWSLYAVNPDGTNRTRLTDQADSGPMTWSPDGRTILFASDRAEGNHDVYRMRVDGTQVLRLTKE